MKVEEMMTKELACCNPDTELRKVARLMDKYDVGSIPVVDTRQSTHVIGIITDRDIATRAVAQGRNPLEMKASDIMSTPVVTVKKDDDVKQAARMMEENMVRRLPVVDENDDLCGMFAQADIALNGSDKLTAEVVQSVSQPTQESSRV